PCAARHDPPCGGYWATMPRGPRGERRLSRERLYEVGVRLSSGEGHARLRWVIPSVIEPRPARQLEGPEERSRLRTGGQASPRARRGARHEVNFAIRILVEQPATGEAVEEGTIGPVGV